MLKIFKYYCIEIRGHGIALNARNYTVLCLSTVHRLTKGDINIS